MEERGYTSTRLYCRHYTDATALPPTNGSQQYQLDKKPVPALQPIWENRRRKKFVTLPEIEYRSFDIASRKWNVSIK